MYLCFFHRLTLLHSERPKLYKVLALISAERLKNVHGRFHVMLYVSLFLSYKDFVFVSSLYIFTYIMSFTGKLTIYCHIVMATLLFYGNIISS